MSGNILQPGHVSKSSDLSSFLISAEYQLTISTTYSGWELWNTILWGNTVFSSLFKNKDPFPYLISQILSQRFPWEYEGQLVLLTVYTADTLLWHVINLLHSLGTNWSPQTAEILQNSWPINTSESKRVRISFCFSLPCAKIWREQGLSKCLIF